MSPKTILNNVNTNSNFDQTYRIIQRRSYKRDRESRKNNENERRKNEPRELHYPYRINNATITRTTNVNTDDPRKRIRILQWNANGIWSKMEQIETLIKDTKADIVNTKDVRKAKGAA